jgi:hypothetical protein
MLGVATFTLYLPDALLVELDEARADMARVTVPVSRSQFLRSLLEGYFARPCPAPRGELDEALDGGGAAMSRSERFARATQRNP